MRAAERQARVGIDTPRAAGFVIEDGDPMRKVRRNSNAAEYVWLDVGDTVGVLGDASDVGKALYLDVIEALDGPDARARVLRKIDDTSEI